jgi:hypothetical protein
VDRVHGAVDRGQRARGHWSSPVTEGEDEPVEAVLGRCSLVTEEWQQGGAPHGGDVRETRRLCRSA